MMLRLSNACLFSILFLLTLVTAHADEHPLNPLTAEEMHLAASLIKAHPQFPARGAFSILTLKEPPKQDVWRYQLGNPITREAFAVVYNRVEGKTLEIVVNLTTQQITAWNERTKVNPAVFDYEYSLADSLVRQDPRFGAALRKRNVVSTRVILDPWAAGDVQIRGREGHRFLRAIVFLNDSTNNPYANPLEGISVLVDLTREEVAEVLDFPPLSLPVPSTNFANPPKDTGRIPLKPLVINRPEGQSFLLDGHHVQWQNWDFRFSFHPREGLVIHTVAYNDHGKIRPVLYRAALSEMVVPYGDTSRTWIWRNAFDVGEYNLGQSVTSIEFGSEVPDHAALVDALLFTAQGKPDTLERAIAVYERDGGLLWKHFNEVNNVNHARRARDLVVFYIATIGNYDYGISYIFHQDGSIEVDISLTGIMLVKGINDPSALNHHDPMATGHLVNRNVLAVNHQHMFNFRIDLDVDGPDNSFTEVDTHSLPPGKKNPYGNAIVMDETLFRSEKEAQRELSLENARKWKFINPNQKNGLGQPTAYLLFPGENGVPYLRPKTSVRKRAGFINHHVWVTEYQPNELYAAGDYPNQSTGGDGLPRYVADNASIINKDLVLWYTLGVTHVPRPEEWPVMPTHHAGFRLIPAGFFPENPALDTR